MTTGAVIFTLAKQTVGLKRLLRAAVMEARFGGKQPQRCVVIEQQLTVSVCTALTTGWSVLCLSCDLGSGHGGILSLFLFMGAVHQSAMF